jgi:hypothetical protein
VVGGAMVYWSWVAADAALARRAFAAFGTLGGYLLARPRFRSTWW